MKYLKLFEKIEDDSSIIGVKVGDTIICVEPDGNLDDNRVYEIIEIYDVNQRNISIVGNREDYISVKDKVIFFYIFSNSRKN